MNFEIYDDMGELWHNGARHPAAFLRAEAKFRLPWILELLSHLPKGVTLLDAGCGGGILSNALAKENYHVTGIDQSQKSLEIARSMGHAHAKYVQGDLYALPFSNNTFDVVFSMDVLEHLEFYPRFIEEVERVLKPNGIFVFYTFNRTYLSKLLVIDALEYLFPESAKGLHVKEWFIKPSELTHALNQHHFENITMQGVRPKIFQKAMAQLLLQRSVSDDFQFCFCKNLWVGYMGTAQKRNTKFQPTIQASSK